MASPQEEWNSIHEDFLEIRVLFLKLLEKCDEIIKSNREFRANLNYLSVNGMGLPEPEIEDTENDLQLAFENPTKLNQTIWQETKKA